MGLRLAFAGLALLSLGGIASAQAKIAVINLQRAVLESAEIKKASADMEAKYKPRQQQLEQLEKDINGIAQQLQTNSKLTPQAQADLQAQGNRKQRDHDRIAQDLQDEVQAERNEILSKSTQKMSDVVKKIAEEKGFDLVVDISNTVYYKGALEITNEAIAAFDKAYPTK
jgi:outer membrane protein